MHLLKPVIILKGEVFWCDIFYNEIVTAKVRFISKKSDIDIEYKKTILQRPTQMPFLKVDSFTFEDVSEYTISKYISKKSKFQLVHIKSPCISAFDAFFAFSTELSNNCGIPCVLEKLIFQGSKKYPYANFLQKAASQCTSTTYSTTKIDYTVYQVTSSGWEGLTKMLPLYVDHLFHPLLADEDFTTEIHHINPDTLEDEGTAYTDLNEEFYKYYARYRDYGMKQTVFSDKSGYRYEEQGTFDSLRELTIEDVREYHKKFYRPDNMCLVVRGNIDEKKLLDCMEQIDQLFDAATEERVRPFVGTETSTTLAPRFNEEILEKSFQIPRNAVCKPEMGFYWVCGLSIEPLINLQLWCIFPYLCQGDSSVFQKEIINAENSMVYYVRNDVKYYFRTINGLEFVGISPENLQTVKEKVLSILSTHKIDLARMKKVIASGRVQFTDDSEFQGPIKLGISCIKSFIYGDNTNCSTLKNRATPLELFDVIESYTEEKWQTIFNKWIIENKPVVAIVNPSEELYEKIKKDDEDRFAKRSLEFDEAKKQELQSTLDKARKRKELAVPPREVLDEFVLENPALGIRALKNTSILSICETDDKNNELLSKSKDLPMFINFEDYPSNYVEMYIHLNSRCITDRDLLPYYHIFCQSFTMPMRLADGTLMAKDKVNECLESDFDLNTICYGGDNTTDVIEIRMMGAYTKYASCVEWIKHVLCDMVFEEESVTELLEEYIEDNGGDISLKSSMNKLLFDKNTLINSLGGNYSCEVLKQALDETKRGNYKSAVLPKLERFRKILLENINQSQVFIFGDVKKIGASTMYEPWIENFGTGSISKIPVMPKISSSLTDLGKHKGQQKAFIFESASKESDDVDLIVSTSLNIGYEHRDYAALVLVHVIFQDDSSPFWTAINGEDTCIEDPFFTMNVERNEITCELFGNGNAIKCYRFIKDIVCEYANGKRLISKECVYDALCAKIEGIMDSQSTYNIRANNACANVYCKGIPSDFNDQLLQSLAKVTKEQVVEVIKNYVLPLFNPVSGSLFISCGPSNTKKYLEFSKDLGYETKDTKVYPVVPKKTD